ncbi:DNA replication/repair protein RecF [Hyphomicrobium sp. MC8b]|uniref:DNA replication/repair protein RecF n=1 Tax=Hyphomicrobium sp. MC8b TaxID=300273 RepID=UPI00391B8875
MASIPNALWVERLQLTNFRSYASASVTTDAGPQVIVGANGSGKTNLLEALSLLSPGQGLRRVPFVDLARAAGDGGFAVAARAHTLAGPADLGTGLVPGANSRGERTGRIVRIDGTAQSGSGILADYLEIVWVTPAMDGLFTGAASERRRFLDRLILCFDHGYRTIAGRFERAMTSRNRLLADGVRDNAQLSGFEQVMAETGIAVAAARLEAVAAMRAIVEKRRARDPNSAFPWSAFRLEGTIEDDLSGMSAVEAEDLYAKTLRDTRERDRGAGRTLDGPHRSDLIVEHGPKALEARHSSTGEQKALLLGLVLAHAELLTERQEGAAPILLLDEITAHLDVHRRAALFDEILRLGAQAWMTGTDADAFSALAEKARFWGVNEGKIEALP